MSVTINDIAQASGVSKATVSYILNNKVSSVRLSPQTVRRVLDVCAEMKYAPSKVAQALSFQKRAGASILVLSPWLYAQHSDFMATFNRTIGKLSAETKLFTSFERFTPGELSKTFKTSRCGKYDAVLIIGTDPVDERYLSRNREKMSGVILLNRQIPDMLSCCSDDRGVCEKLAGMIARDRKYKKYVIVRHGKPGRREKLRSDGFAAGIRKKLKCEGTEIPLFIAEIGDDALLPEECARVLDEYAEKGTVFFFGTHLMAAHMTAQANKRRLEIPDEIGIVGFDRNSVLDDFLFPAMTTIDPKIGEMTEKSIALALQLKAGKKPESVVVTPEIVRGGSCLLPEE
ncbi:MAG: LacI family transcriptional regulator [Victivallaceae bacterium]|nr:LacI family transcriptional regulator [Victivallaceae bacterium]